MADPKLLQRDTGARNRVFSYTLGITSLNFTLRTDVKKHLKDFLQLLEAATKDVKEELEKKS